MKHTHTYIFYTFLLLELERYEKNARSAFILHKVGNRKTVSDLYLQVVKIVGSEDVQNEKHCQILPKFTKPQPIKENGLHFFINKPTFLLTY